MGNPYVGIGTGPDTQGWSLWISSVVCVILAGIFVAARFIARLRQDYIGPDDWILLAALISSVVLSVTEIEAVANGYGARYATLTWAQAVIARKWFYGAQIAYKVVLAFNKASICYMYFRIFKLSSKAFRTSCYALLAFIIVSNTAFIIGTIFQCNPIAAFWDKSIKPTFCFNQTPWWISYACLQIILDFMLLALPVKEVLKLKMSNLDRVGLIVVFSTGLFVTFTSIYRATTLASSATNPDPTYGPIPATTWTVIEANAGIIAACLPLLRQPFLTVFRCFARASPQPSRAKSYEHEKHGPVREIGASLFETTVDNEHHDDRESQEQIVKKDGNIYVMSDVSVTSSPKREQDAVSAHQRAPQHHHANFPTSTDLRMETFLRTWREDALSKHQYESAIFVGNKVLALTNSDSDAIALAQIHFAAANYTRALSFVSREDLIQRSPVCKYLAAHCHVKQSRYDDALQLLGDKNPTHLSAVTDSARRKLQHVERGSSLKSLKPRPQRIDRSEERELEDPETIKYEAGMCYLRGLCYAKQNAFDKAKECYKEAVRIDIQCFEAFEQLTKNSLMSPDEEWKFLSTLNFDTIPHDGKIDTSTFVRNLYITRLSKYTRPEEFGEAIESLSSHYKLANNADILLAKADMLYTSSRYQPALALTSKILEKDPYNFSVIPLHLALLHHLEETNILFAFSHDLADTHPQEPCSWLAVGTYYLTIGRIPEARSYFSKASLMDPHFGPAWIGFAHTFAAEGESEQAIAAYSTAARLFQGTHLPQLFLGMQEVAIGNINVAKEYLSSAYAICERDPLLLNEIGVVAYMEGDFDSACMRFQLALEIAKDNEAPAQQYLSTRLNLAQAQRKAGRFEEALDEFDEVIRLGSRDCSVFSSKALVLLELEQPFEAVVVLHEALAISPQDPIASELLAPALRLLENTQVLGAEEEAEVDQSLQQSLKLARRKTAERKKKPRTRRAFESMELDGFQDNRS